jgi:hypothetical protein
VKTIILRAAIALGCVVALGGGFVGHARAQTSPHSFIIGVNRPHLAWTDNANDILDQIAANFPAVRLSANGPIDKVAQTVIHARRDGLHVLLVIPMGLADFYDKGAAPRPGAGSLRAVNHLSQLNVTLLHDQVAHLVSELDQAKVALDAIEVGNEINWSGFNGDLPVFGVGRAYNDINEMGEYRQNMMEGLRRYALAVKTIKNILRASAFQQHTIVVGAGLASEMKDAFLQRSGGTTLPPRAFNAALKQFDGAADLDAFAIHIYPNVGEQGAGAQAAIVDTVASALDECAPDGRDCYITEWGFVLPSDSCPTPDPRNVEFRIFLDAVQREEASHPVKAAYVYDWDTSSIRGIYRCGRLLPDKNALH